ncbi:MAG: T9SS type A sorting domain-containing protein, partial [Brumimicrobium sp.]|nr:T9SS type A sorting domain-containing protein [Brumimicrobium sp.]
GDIIAPDMTVNGYDATLQNVDVNTIWQNGIMNCACPIEMTDIVTVTVNNSSTGTDVQTACDSYTWIDGNTYTTDNNTATFVLTNAAGCDSTVTLDLTIVNSSAGTDVQEHCGSYTWIDGNTYTMSNNTATFVLPNAAGCDSTVTLDLTINPVPSAGATNNNDGTLSATGTGTYQWIDCNTGNPIIGETGAMFSPVADGDYAVIVTDGNCSDTSNCVNYSTVGLNDYLTNHFSVYPNPTNGKVTIKSNNTMLHSVVVRDASGRKIFEATMNATETGIDLTSMEDGVYFVTILGSDNTQVIAKIIKQ